MSGTSIIGNPRLLRQTDAARYLGVSRNTFLADVDAGMWPGPVIRRGSIILWDRRQLDAAVDRLAGLAGNAGWDDI